MRRSADRWVPGERGTRAGAAGPADCAQDGQCSRSSCCGDVAWQLLLCGLACLRAVERQICRRCGWCSAEVQFSWAKISLLADESIPASWNPMASCHPSCRVVGLADDPRARDMDNG